MLHIKKICSVIQILFEFSRQEKKEATSNTRCTALLDKLVVAQLVRKFSAFMELEGSL
jgi:hypothetical protein